MRECTRTGKNVAPSSWDLSGGGKGKRLAREGKRERLDQELGVAGGRRNSDSEIQRCK